MYRAGIAQSVQGPGYRLNDRGVGVAIPSTGNKYFSSLQCPDGLLCPFVLLPIGMGKIPPGEKRPLRSNVEVSIVWRSIIASSWRDALIKHSLIEVGPESDRWMELAHYNV